jgi:hypothetical protein
MTRVVILQPSYIPWRGYFDLVRRADIFVFYDDVQYDTRGWRNRNRIKTPHGSKWLTIPVHKKGAQTQDIPINRIRFANQEWAAQHRDAFARNYREAPFYDTNRDLLDDLFELPGEFLADYTVRTTVRIAGALGISEPRFIRSSSLGVTGAKTDRLLAVLEAVGGTHYLSGPSARNYIEADKFAAAEVKLEWMSYDYPEYPQLHPPYDPQVSVLDVMLMTGPEALTYFDAPRSV